MNIGKLLIIDNFKDEQEIRMALLAKGFNVKEVSTDIIFAEKVSDYTQEILQVGDLQLNTLTYTVFRGKSEIKLTSLEFKLLKYLMANKDQVISRERLIAHCWQKDEIETRVVDVYMGYLRKKIDTGFEQKIVQSKRGFGYIITDKPFEPTCPSAFWRKPKKEITPAEKEARKQRQRNYMKSYRNGSFLRYCQNPDCTPHIQYPRTEMIERHGLLFHDEDCADHYDSYFYSGEEDN